MKVLMDCSGDFKVGDPMPDGYIDRAQWADVHLKAGLRQRKCSVCMLWWFPHQLTDKEIIGTAHRRTRNGWAPVKLVSYICKACDEKKGSK